jgi:hypothetical protein
MKKKPSKPNMTSPSKMKMTSKAESGASSMPKKSKTKKGY